MGWQKKDLKKPEFQKVSDYVWDIPTSFKKGMQVPARIFASKPLLDKMDLMVYDQVTNVATLPGIVNHAMCMPDGHSGYGFPIGGVAAMDINNGGVISPGGIGFDINCGMRLMTTNLPMKDVGPKMKELVDLLFKYVPAGVGSAAFEESKGAFRLSREQFKEILETGSKWCVEQGYGWEEDLQRIEMNGSAKEADVSKVSDKAIKRGASQVGTLGSGNHYLEIQEVKEENIFDKELAKQFGLFPGQTVVMWHTGSRGCGHQIASDYLQKFLSVMHSKYGIKILDRELACAPFNSPEGQDYYKAMQCGANMGFANRQMIMHRIREAFSKVFNQDAESLDMHLIFDISHNRGSLEKHKVDGETKELIVHRKGATAAYGPGREEIPELYRNTGVPVIIGGSMDTGSYLLVGTEGAKQTFYSTCHGSGRTMSRTKARKMFRGEKIQKDMSARGIIVKPVSFSVMAEETGPAYKDVHEVINTVHNAGISKKVVSLVPRGNVKG